MPLPRTPSFTCGQVSFPTAAVAGLQQCRSMQRCGASTGLSLTQVWDVMFAVAAADVLVRYLGIAAKAIVVALHSTTSRAELRRRAQVGAPVRLPSVLSAATAGPGAPCSQAHAGSSYPAASQLRWLSCR